MRVANIGLLLGSSLEQPSPFHTTLWMLVPTKTPVLALAVTHRKSAVTKIHDRSSCAQSVVEFFQCPSPDYLPGDEGL
jgi:hypothetical protein